MDNKQQKDVGFHPIDLPKGGGAIRGMEASLGAIGADGSASMTLPLPILPGRGYAPKLALQYHSGSGNGVFGVGWQLTLPRIARQTNKGVPAYNDEDVFLDPTGEVLVPELHVHTGSVNSKKRNTLRGYELPTVYTVTRYLPRVESGFDRIECWKSTENCFWLIHASDGQLHIFGKSEGARVRCGPLVAEWLLEGSLSPTGEHIKYCYQSEETAKVGQQPEIGALPHLVEVCYGNQKAHSIEHVLDPQNTSGQVWLFHLVFDYGRSEFKCESASPYTPSTTWLQRKDPFSNYHYGFKTRCLRLCRQVRMYQSCNKKNQRELVSELTLEYDENRVMSQLIGAQTRAYGPACKESVSLPPVEWRYSHFNKREIEGNWKEWKDLPGMDDGQPWQMIDLYGEGLPGILYRTGKGWCYREPIRSKNGGKNAVTYASSETVPVLPTLANQAKLMDSNGDGRLDWVITQPGMAGFFTLNPDRSVSAFTPFSAVPNELFHPQAQMASLMGSGLSDLALIGPKSVRLYANQREGYGKAQECIQSDGVTLPVPGADKMVLVAFADLLGSGQQHLVEVRADGVSCWPNLGRGRFGKPVPLADWTTAPIANFDPDRVYLADLDGSGAADLIIAQETELQVYFNQSGNAFGEPKTIALPNGVIFDRLCRLTVADVEGKGVSSLILSTPLPNVRHWRLDLCTTKPYLLDGFNNNMGADKEIHYRSSVQFWLDEKKSSKTKDMNKKSFSRLPFPIHTVARVITLDEVTGNTLSQDYRYYRGVYDGKEREFRGFGLVESEDSTPDSAMTGGDIPATPTLLTRTWYHLGFDDGKPLPDTWNGDSQAFSFIQTTRFTEWKDKGDKRWACKSKKDESIHWWMVRALKGHVLRQEVFGLDKGNQCSPYTVSEYRYQVRLVQKGYGLNAPVVLPLTLEQLNYQYERVPLDPQCSGQVLLESNEYGQATHSVSVHYPRRSQPNDALKENSAFANLPSSALGSSYDDQQQVLRLIESRSQYYQLDTDDYWSHGIPAVTRQDVVQLNNNYIELVSCENCRDFTEVDSRTYAGQQQYFYASKNGIPTKLPVLLSYIETAELEGETPEAYSELREVKIKDELNKAGYKLSHKLDLPPSQNDSERKVWIAAHSFQDYYGNKEFYALKNHRNSEKTGMTTLYYDVYGFLASSTDPEGNATIVAAMDYATLSPTSIKDINNNIDSVKLDPLGRVESSWFYGTEMRAVVGFDRPDANDLKATQVNELLERAIHGGPLSVAVRQSLDLFSWMVPVGDDEMQGKGIDYKDVIIEEKGRYRLKNRALRKLPGPRASISGLSKRVPPHVATLKADRYPNDRSQQIHAEVRYYDGFGRVLQTLTKDEPGKAYILTEDGELQVDDNDHLIEENTHTRWTVSGRVEYDNKGLVRRTYQPYFVNSWQYESDSSLRACGYADLHHYDALGREICVETAAGYERRVHYFPWFTVSEDENDLLHLKKPSS